MFGGADLVLGFYETVVKTKARQTADPGRAPLNLPDLEQELRKVVFRCWELQTRSHAVRNFDILVKHAMDNALRTLIGREYCTKRGRCKIIMFSELSVSDDGESEVDVESIIHQNRDDAICVNGTQSGLEHLMAEIHLHLDDPKLRKTFDTIVLDHEFEYLNPDRIPNRQRKQISNQLGMGEGELLEQLQNINFILCGFQENFQQRVWR